MAIEIKTVTTKKDLKTFVRFANKMYKGNKFYVPSMPMDDLKTLDKNYNAAFAFRYLRNAGRYSSIAEMSASRVSCFILEV